MHKALSVSDAEVGRRNPLRLGKHDLVVEPGAAVGLAALLAGQDSNRMEDTVVMLSGGNVDPALHARIIAEAA